MRRSTRKTMSARPHIIAQAGRVGAVTIATNMAGRGTDILLGGNPDVLADDVLLERGLDPDLRSPACSPPSEGTPAGAHGGPSARRRSICRRKRAKPSRSASWRRAACASSAPSATRADASTTSCAAVPAVRAIRAPPSSTCRSKTTLCACSAARAWTRSAAMMEKTDMPDDMPIQASMVSKAIESRSAPG